MSEKRKNPSIKIEGWNLEASYQDLPAKLFSRVHPVPVKDPKIVLYNEDLGKDLGLNIEALDKSESPLIFSGNEIPEGGLPIAQAYAGHQFGHFTVLGDGRAILLGEQVTPMGERMDIQLKGSGATPYSRRGDGRAALGPMLREYIISEAMYALGIPSTRALAVVSTGERILREKRLPGAILTRVASSHIRVGTFEYISQFGNREDLEALVDYTIKRHFPEIEKEFNEKSHKDREPTEEHINEKTLRFFDEVLDRQVSLIAKWQLVGFIHGVMNTDNMAISGETIDYGPCAFMNTYDPDTVFSSIDRRGRYAYKNQPGIGQWNLARFAETLLPLIHRDQTQGVKLTEKHLQKFTTKYHNYWLEGMGKKLGMFQIQKDDEGLIEELLQIMKEESLDFTNTFVALTYGKEEELSVEDADRFDSWLKKWEKRLDSQEKTREEEQELMKKSNPVVIPRNHQVEKALSAAVDKSDYRVMEDLMKVLSEPYRYSEENEVYRKPPGPDEKPYVTYCGT